MVLSVTLGYICPFTMGRSGGGRGVFFVNVKMTIMAVPKMKTTSGNDFSVYFQAILDHYFLWKNIENWKSYIDCPHTVRWVTVPLFFFVKMGFSVFFGVLRGFWAYVTRDIYVWYVVLWVLNLSPRSFGTVAPILDIWEQKTGHLKSVKCNGHTDFRCFSFFRCFERFLGICYQGHICMICCPMGS